MCTRTAQVQGWCGEPEGGLSLSVLVGGITGTWATTVSDRVIPGLQETRGRLERSVLAGWDSKCQGPSVKTSVAHLRGRHRGVPRMASPVR